MKRGAHGRWRGLQWEFGHMGMERGGATMRSPMCLLMKVAYAPKNFSSKMACCCICLYQYRYRHLFPSVPLGLTCNQNGVPIVPALYY